MRAGYGFFPHVISSRCSGFGLTESVSLGGDRRVLSGPGAGRADTVARAGCSCAGRVQLGALGASAGGRDVLTESVSTAHFGRGPRVQCVRPTGERRRSRPGRLDTYRVCESVRTESGALSGQTLVVCSNRVCESVRTESGALLAGMSRVLATGAPIRSVLSASLTQSERTRGVKWLGSESREWA